MEGGGGGTVVNTHVFVHVYCMSQYTREYACINSVYLTCHRSTRAYFIRPYIVIVIVITTYHAVYWRYRASRTDRWFLPCSISWVPGLPEVAHGMMEDPEDRGYRPRGWGSGNCRALALATAPGLKGQGIGMQQHSNKQQASACPMGAQ